MSLVDVAMVGHLGPEALAATGMGGMLAWGALSIVLGIRTSVQTITSRRLGQKKTKECINALINGFILASAYALPISILGYSYGYLIIPANSHVRASAALYFPPCIPEVHCSIPFFLVHIQRR